MESALLLRNLSKQFFSPMDPEGSRIAVDAFGNVYVSAAGGTVQVFAVDLPE